MKKSIAAIIATLMITVLIGCMSILDNYTPATFEASGATATMSGVIDGTTPERVEELIAQHPTVKTIVMQDVEGSADDQANLVAARMVRQHGFHTHVPADGEIASGGVDFFLAGVERTVADGAKLGVHSWAGDDTTGDQVPRDDPQHKLYLDYYAEMGIPADFYWFTLQAAPAEDIHWMTANEIIRYQMVTVEIAANATPPDTVNNRDGATTTHVDPVSNLTVVDIAPVPDSFPSNIRATFDRYTQVIPPNRRPINIYAQNRINDAQMIQARNTLIFWLTDVADTTYGADKSAVANQMGENEAILMLLNGSDGESAYPDVDGQPLFETELIVPGSAAYINNDYENHRDATFEEILHLVHDTGIGVDGPHTRLGARPDFQAEIRAATNNAIANNYQLWPQGATEEPEWFNELSAENSLTQEYLAAVVDSYYGLWGAFEEADAGMWGEYVAKTRADIEAKDPMGAALMSKFFSPYLTYNAQLDATFDGTFTMSFDPTAPYTYKSQYLLHATFDGQQQRQPDWQRSGQSACRQ